MNRKTIKSGTRGIHITLPIRMLEKFDEGLLFKSSRSKAIANLMQAWIDSDANNLYSYTELELLEQLKYRFKKDSSEDILIQTLIKLLS